MDRGYGNGGDVLPTWLELEPPRSRSLQVYALDPNVGSYVNNRITIQVPWEPLLPGPVGAKIAVVDYDAGNECYYPPVDLEHPLLLARQGLDPTESDPRFHQQMVYAVASRTIEMFESALGRDIRWRRHERNVDPASPAAAWHKTGDIEVLHLYPHAMHEANAYYSPDAHGIVFGYFCADTTNPGRNLPDQRIFTCLSPDIIAHEMTHAIIDGIRTYFTEPTNPDVLAFHEAFADLCALFAHFSLTETLVDAIRRTGGRLHNADLAAPSASRSVGGWRAPGRGDHRCRAPPGQPADPAGRPVRPGPGRAGRPPFRHRRPPHPRGHQHPRRRRPLPGVDPRVRRVRRLLQRLPPPGREPVRDLPGRRGRTDRRPAGPDGPAPGRHRLRHRLVLLPDLRAGPRRLPPGRHHLRRLPPGARHRGPRRFARTTRAACATRSMEAFRLRGIYPEGSEFFSEDALVWPQVTPGTLPPIDSRTIVNPRTQSKMEAGLIFGQPSGLTRDEKDINGAVLRAWVAEHSDALGLDRDQPISIPSFHSVFRVEPNGRTRVEMIVEIVQSTAAEVEPGLPQFGAIPFRGGATLVINGPRRGLSHGVSIALPPEVRFVIGKALSGRGGRAALVSPTGLRRGQRLGFVGGDGRYEANFRLAARGTLRWPRRRKADQIRVRMYRVGFGDFFLLTVPGNGGPAHILIDCGVHAKPVDGAMDRCVADLKATTGGRLALVIATHHHADHLSGFATNYDDFLGFDVGMVWITNRLDPSNAGRRR